MRLLRCTVQFLTNEGMRHRMILQDTGPRHYAAHMRILRSTCTVSLGDWTWRLDEDRSLLASPDRSKQRTRGGAVIGSFSSLSKRLAVDRPVANNGVDRRSRRHDVMFSLGQSKNTFVSPMALSSHV